MFIKLGIIAGIVILGGMIFSNYGKVLCSVNSGILGTTSLAVFENYLNRSECDPVLSNIKELVVI